MTPEDVQANVDALAAQVSTIAADLATTKSQIPTLEELIFEASLARFNGADQITGSPAWSFFYAPIKCRVLSVACFWEYLTIGGSDTNYWRLTLQKGSDVAGWVDVAQRSTQNNGAIANGGINNREPWTFDSAAWSDATLQAGQAMRVAFSPIGNIGTTNPITFPLLLSGRYTPVA